MDDSDFETAAPTSLPFIKKPVVSSKPKSKPRIGPRSKVGRAHAYAPEDAHLFESSSPIIAEAKLSKQSSPSSADSTAINSDKESSVVVINDSEDDFIESNNVWETDQMKVALLDAPRLPPQASSLNKRDRSTAAITKPKTQQQQQQQQQLKRIVRPPARPMMKFYKIKEYEMEESENLEVIGETPANEIEGSSEDVIPCRSLDNFVIFDRFNNNAVIEPVDIYEEGVNMSISGFVGALNISETDDFVGLEDDDDDDDEEQDNIDGCVGGSRSSAKANRLSRSSSATSSGDDQDLSLSRGRIGSSSGSCKITGFGESGNTTQRINLSAILSCEAYQTKNGDTEIWVRTLFAWYKLLTPHPEYAYAFEPFYKTAYMAHQALRVAAEEPNLSIAQYIKRMKESSDSTIDCMTPISDSDFRKYRDDIIYEIDACAEASDISDRMVTPLIRSICRLRTKGHGDAMTAAAKVAAKQSNPRTRGPAKKKDNSSKAENPACITTLVASIAKGLYAQHLVNVSHFESNASSSSAADSSTGSKAKSKAQPKISYAVDSETEAETTDTEWRKKYAGRTSSKKALAEQDLGKISVSDLQSKGVAVEHFKIDKIAFSNKNQLPQITADKHYYSQVDVTKKHRAGDDVDMDGKETIKVGDTVLVSVIRPSTDHALETIWDTEATESGELVNQKTSTVNGPFVRIFQVTMIMYSVSNGCWMFHGQLLLPGRDTILQEVALPNEFYLVDQCHTLSLHASVCGKIDIPFIPTRQEVDTFDMVAKNKLFCRFWYDPSCAMYEDVNLHLMAIGRNIPMWCPSCKRKEKTESVKLGRAIVGSRVVSKTDPLTNITRKVTYPVYTQTATVNGIEYHINDVIYYPSQHSDQPFEIGHILKFHDKRAFVNKNTKTTPMLYAEIQVLKRVLVLPPENRPPGANRSYNDGRHLYWTPQTLDIDISKFRGKCWVAHPEEIKGCLNVYKDSDPNAFFAQYESSKLWPNSPSHWAELKPNPGHGNADEAIDVDDAYSDIMDERMPAPPYCRLCKHERENRTDRIGRFLSNACAPSSKSAGKDSDLPRTSFMRGKHPLRALDLFSGCGGLTQGMDQSGIVKTMWAVEFMESAAITFSKNHPHAQVYNQCSNLLLDSAIKAHQGIQFAPLVNKFDGTPLPPMPQPGDVDFIYCGPPCQGFSRCNRFLKADDIKTSLVANALSYVDFYRPTYFLLENVRGLLNYRLGGVQQGKGRIGGGIEMGMLKFILRTLTTMGYQTRFYVLQAGNYGLAQSRRRLFVWGCKRGCKLPGVPHPLTTFEKSNQTNINFPDGTVYSPFGHLNGNAPHHAITVEDAIGDLPKFEFINPAIVYPDPDIELRNPDWEQLYAVYGSGPGVSAAAAELSYVGRMVREYTEQPKSEFQRLRRRKQQICMPGMDNTYDELVEHLYNHACRKFNALNIERICRVVLEPGKDHSSLPEKLKPWCLTSEHSAASRHNGWKGLYGRVNPKGCFGTALTEMSPMGKSGTVLLYDQRRVLSVRECARAQGFPDTFRLYDFDERSVKDMHKQVGNAVPPPLAYALSLELRDALFADYLAHSPESSPDSTNCVDSSRLSSNVSGKNNGDSNYKNDAVGNLGHFYIDVGRKMTSNRQRISVRD
ncbi:hypothetical protein GGI07_001260 [Coemansia sp. Benny D115]|nr:hypothetical protein GGI07_001260 [Coemansia sp. Benny D115]